MEEDNHDRVEPVLASAPPPPLEEEEPDFRDLNRRLFQLQPHAILSHRLLPDEEEDECPVPTAPPPPPPPTETPPSCQNESPAPTTLKPLTEGQLFGLCKGQNLEGTCQEFEDR